jgi:hypothetical protein
MDRQVHGSGLHDQISHRQSDIMVGMTVRLAIMIKMYFGDREHKQGSLSSPDLVPLSQTTEKLLMFRRMIDCRHNEDPGLFVERGGCPSSRFQQALDFFSFYRLIRKGPWTPSPA